MNEKFNELYSYLKSEGMTDLDSKTFYNKYSDPSKSREIYSYLKSNNMTDLDESSFHSAYFGGKKKEHTVSPSQSAQGPSSSGTQPKKKPQPSASSYEVISERRLPDGSYQTVIMGDAGKGRKAYAIKKSPDGRESWYEYSHTNQLEGGRQLDIFDKPITDPSRVATLNSKFGKKASTVSSQDVFTGFPGKENNEYKVQELSNGQEVWTVRRKGQNEFTVISDTGSISALNREFGKSIKPSEDAKKKREAQITRQKSHEEFKGITSDFIGGEEELAVDVLRKRYGNLGFNFTETGKGDQIRVAAANGQTMTVYLDNWSDETDREQARNLRKFLQENQQLGDYIDLEAEENKKNEQRYLDITKVDVDEQRARLMSAVSQEEFEKAKEQNVKEAAEKTVAVVGEEARQLREKIINDDYNKKQRIADLSRAVNTEEEKRDLAAIAMANRESFVESNKINDQYLNDLALSRKDIAGQLSALNNEINELNSSQSSMTEEEYNSEMSRIKDRYDELISKDREISDDISKVYTIEDQNQNNAALYFAYNEKQGSVPGGLWNSFVKGLFSVTGLIDPDAPEAFAKILGSEMTTEEFMQSEDRWGITKAAFSMSESTGALVASMLSGGAAGAAGVTGLASTAVKTMPFFSMSYNEIKAEMEGDEFRDVPAWQKEGLAIAYGLGVGYLDRISTVFGVTGKIPQAISKGIIFRAISGLEKGATTEAIERAIAAQFKKDITAGTIKIVGGNLLEGATEGVQSAYGSALKAGFNWIKGEDKFNVSSWAEDAMYEAYMGLLGGAIMSVPSGAARGIKNGFNRMNPEYMEMTRRVIEDSNLRSMLMTDIKTKLMSGKITKEEAQEQINAIKEASGLFAKMPDNLSPEDVAKSTDLLIERSKIEKEIAGKEDNLVSAQKARIAEINNELQTISQNAVQKQTTDESVLREEQPEVGLQEVEQVDSKQEVVTEEGQQEEVAPSLVTIENATEFERKASEIDIAEGSDRATKASRAAKSVLRALPGVKVHLHTDTNSYRDGVARASGIERKQIDVDENTAMSAGSYINGEIHIDLSNPMADMKTVYHEAFHHAITKIAPKEGQLREMTTGLKKALSGKHNDMVDQIEEFENMYSGDLGYVDADRAEEFLSELAGTISANAETLETSTLQKIATVINKIAQKVIGRPVLSEAASRQEIVDFMNTLSRGFREGRDVSNILANGVISDVTSIKKQLDPVKVRDGYNISYVKKEDLVDIEALVADIEAKGQKVWFWVADQLGRGMYSDNVINDQHFLDAGPSFALDPENRDRNVIWASGLDRSKLEKYTSQADYIFIISGSPTASKLFNKQVYNLFVKRAGDYDSFKDGVLKTSKMSSINKFFEQFNSWDEIESGSFKETDNKPAEPARKWLLRTIESTIKPKKGTDLKSFLESRGAILDIDSLRDDFYRENGFDLNDVMLVLKPTGVGGKSSHSTYETDILGEVVGVPDKKVNAADIMPDDIYEKIKSLQKSQASQKIAPYGVGMRTVKSVRRESEIEQNDIKKQISNIPKTKIGIQNELLSIGYSKKDLAKILSVEGLRGLYKIEVLGLGIGSLNADEFASLYDIHSTNIRGGKPVDYSELKKGMTGGWTAAPNVYSTKSMTYDKVYKPGHQIVLVRRNHTLSNPSRIKEGYIPYEFEVKILTEDSFTNGVIDYKKVFGIGRDIKKQLSGKPKKTSTQKKIDKTVGASKKTKKVTVNEATALKDQLRLEARAAKDGAKSVADAVKDIASYFNEIKDTRNLTRKDITRILNVISSVKDQKSLDNAVDKISSIVDRAKSDIIEVSASEQIRTIAREVRQSSQSLKQKQRQLVAMINEMKRGGIVTAQQASALAKRVVMTNVDNPIMVERMLQYAERLFERADYQEKLQEAKSLQKKIKSKLQSNGLQASVVPIAKDFSKIQAWMLSDIDAYIEQANSVLSAVRPSRQTADMTVDLRTAMSFEQVGQYVEEANKEIEEYRKAEILAVNDDLVQAGVISKDMNLKEILEIMSELMDPETKLPAEDKRAAILAYIGSVMDVYRPIVESMINGNDAFTGEAVELTDRQKEVALDMLKIDVTKMDVRDAVRVIEAMDNFITNGIIDGVEAITNTYKGQRNAEQVASKGLKTKSIGAGKIGSLWGYNMMSLPVLSDWIFRGTSRAQYVLDKMGVTDFINGVSKATSRWRNYIDEYHNEFNKKKANGKNFMDAENIYERGMYAFLKRTVTGDQTAQDKELKRKIKLIKDSVDVLREEGDAKDAKVADMYEMLIDKLGLNDANLTISDIQARVDKVNMDAVNWWINTWSDNYGQLADVSQSIYNTILDKDMFYTPDKFSSLDPNNSKAVDDLMNKMGGGGFANVLNYEYDKKTGVLMPSSKPVSMEQKRYVNLNFDNNNQRALKAALIDINTAAATKQIKGFFKSRSWNKIVSNKDDRDLFRKRVDEYILRARNKQTGSDDRTIGDVERSLRVWASMGATRALGSIFQPFKQTVPVFVNTLFNTGKHITFAFNRDQHRWIDALEMPISNRGIESIAAFEDADKNIDRSIAAGKLDKALEIAEKVNTKWLKLVLAKPDVFAARSSFIAYYKKALEAKGKSTDIDYSNPADVDQEALNYAQHMVDRQQNASDAMLMGDLFTSGQSLKKILKNTLFPFMSFVINQKSRMATDLSIRLSKDSSTEDKKAATWSLVGLAAEMAAFHSLSFAIKYYIVNAIASAIGGEDEPEEEDVKKSLERQLSYTIGTIVKDIFSPVPVLTDTPVIYGADWLMEKVAPSYMEDDAKEALKTENEVRELAGKPILEGKKAQDFIDKYIEERRYKASSYDSQGPGGVYRITLDKGVELYKSMNLAYNGEFETEGFGGRMETKYIDSEGKDKMKEIMPYYMAWAAFGIPAEFGSIFRKIENNVKKEHKLTEKQHEALNEVLDATGRKKEGKLEKYLVTKMRATQNESASERVLNELDWIESRGGLKNERQVQKYIEIFEADGSVGIRDMEEIQKLK